MDLLKKEFNHTVFNVMTPTSRSGSVDRRFIVEAEIEPDVFKCRIIKSTNWYTPGSSYSGEADYENNQFMRFTRMEIEKLIL